MLTKEYQVITIKLNIELEARLSDEQKQTIKNYWCLFQEVVSEKVENFRGLRQRFTTKEEVVHPKHSILCDCRRCEPSFNSYIKRLRSI